MDYFIENEWLRVGVRQLGGCLCSIFDKKGNEEVLYQPEPDSWQGQDVAIFPFIARLKNKVYTHNGKEYSLKNHGLCRYYDFRLVKQEKDSLTVGFSSSEETLKEYPFPFYFEATYTLKGDRLIVAYEVTNKGNEPMPFGIGAHPAFKVDGEVVGGKLSTNGNYIDFGKKVSATRAKFDEKGEFVLGEEGYGEVERIEVTKELIQKYQTLALKTDEVKDVTLIRKNGKRLFFHYDTMRYFILWSFPTTGSFVAIEPWMSLPDYDDADKEIRSKKTLLTLNPGESYHFQYSVSLS